MNRIWKEIGLSLILGIFLPALVLYLSVWMVRESPVDTVRTTEVTENSENFYILVLNESGQIREMELEEYVTGVVLAEMPASFEPEALKAQAVVARTYTARAHNSSKHETAAVCTDSSCCQAYMQRGDYLKKGGTEADLQKVRSAVLSTQNLILTYEGELVEATYFSCSGGSTEDAVAVWGTEVPYLVATESPGEENAAHYQDTEIFSAAEFAEMLSLESSDSAEDWFGEISYTEGGGIATATICGKEFTGTELRTLLNLRSTAIEFCVSDGAVTVTTRGYGHRVGMSQYGADAMALQGSTYDQILAHYYRGTELRNLND